MCKRCGARRNYPARLEWGDRYDDYRELAASSLSLRRLARPEGELAEEFGLSPER